MSDYTHLLLAIDLSEHSDQVAIKARRIADACNAKLSVIHVIEPISFSYGGDIPLDFTSIQEDIQAQPQSRESARNEQNLGILKSKCENKNASKIYNYKCGEVFNIGWTWINNGRKPWPEDTQLMQIAGHEIEMLKPCKLNKVINPDRKFTMYVDFKAPSKPGKYHAFFKLSHNPYTYG